MLLAGKRGMLAPAIISPVSGSTQSTLIGGSSSRSSSNPALSESRRRCSATLCDVFFPSTGGNSGTVVDDEVGSVFRPLPFAFPFFSLDPPKENENVDVRPG